LTARFVFALSSSPGWALYSIASGVLFAATMAPASAAFSQHRRWVTGLTPRCFTKLVTALRREGADAARKRATMGLVPGGPAAALPGNRNDCKAWDEALREDVLQSRRRGLPM